MVRILILLLLLMAAMPTFAATRTIHVLVALCDNQYQGIVPVPAALGDGQDPRSNLYWGAAYGIKTFFNRQSDWRRIEAVPPVSAPILERVIYRHVTEDVYLVADAYDGRHIRQTTVDLFDYAAGLKPVDLRADGKTLHVGGRADLLVYVGHDGLMDFRLNSTPVSQGTSQANRQAAVFACMSQRYFSEGLAKAGIAPAMLTTQLMAPEAYVVHALADAWVHRRTPEQTHLQVATAYSRYQKLSRPARRLFTTQYLTGGQ